MPTDTPASAATLRMVTASHPSVRVIRISASSRSSRLAMWLRLIGSPAYPIDEQHWRTAGRIAHQRGIYPAGSMCHTAAFMGAGDLRPRLAKLTMPTLVVQGEADPVQSWRAGKATADAIPGARFLLLPGVGHDLPREVWPTVIDEIRSLTNNASTRRIVR